MEQSPQIKTATTPFEKMQTTDQKNINKAADLNRSYIAPEIARQRLRTIEALDIKSGEHILDIGCGTGFLTYEMALIVGDEGRIQAIDISDPMIDHTLDRCRDLSQVSAKVGDVCNLNFEDNSFDAITCTQVLLYVENIDDALAEMHRVLKPGGRIAVLETDWRGVVMSSNYPEITETIMKTWDKTVASPNLPPRLSKLLKQKAFKAIRTEAIPLLNTSFSKNSFSVNTVPWLSKNAYRMDAITKEDGQVWVEDLVELGRTDAYFFCLNRFLFIAIK
ncbi:MAG: methyltransferase domain-containing protein [Gammaproteobacteria bacterium]|nr:methyltransferase domain-containing protein [Gammaproteobacteria bacterium]